MRRDVGVFRCGNCRAVVAPNDPSCAACGFSFGAGAVPPHKDRPPIILLTQLAALVAMVWTVPIAVASLIWLPVGLAVSAFALSPLVAFWGLASRKAWAKTAVAVAAIAIWTIGLVPLVLESRAAQSPGVHYAAVALALAALAGYLFAFFRSEAVSSFLASEEPERP